MNQFNGLPPYFRYVFLAGLVLLAVAWVIFRSFYPELLVEGTIDSNWILGGIVLMLLGITASRERVEDEMIQQMRGKLLIGSLFYIFVFSSVWAWSGGFGGDAIAENLLMMTVMLGLYLIGFHQRKLKIQ